MFKKFILWYFLFPGLHKHPQQVSISTCSSQGAPCAQRPHKPEQEHFSTRTSSGDASLLNPGESEVFLVRKDKEAIKHCRKRAEKNTVSQITSAPSKYSILESNTSLHLVEGITSICQKGINSDSDCTDQGSRKKALSALLAHRKDKHSVVKIDSSSCSPTAILKRKKINVDPRRYTYEETHVLKSDSFKDHRLPGIDMSPLVKHSHAAAERKRKVLNKEEVCDSPSNGLLKGPKKPRIDHDDGNRVKIQAENNRVSQEAKGLDVTVTVQVKMQENQIVETLKKRKKKKKRPEKEGISREVKELEAPCLSQKARLRLLVKGQLKKAKKDRDAVCKAKEIKGPHSLEKQDSKYSTEFKSVCSDSEDAGVEDFFVKRRDKEKDVKEDEEMDQKSIQETGFVHHENIFAEESDNHMCVDSCTHRSNSRDVDLIGSQTWTEVPEARKKVTEDPGRKPSPYETSHACWLDDPPTVVDNVDTEVKNLPRVGEKALEKGHSLVVKKALVKKYISPSTTNMKTSDVVNIGEPEQVLKQKVKQGQKKKISKVEVQPEERGILNAYGPNLISVLNKHKAVRIEEPRKGSPAMTEHVTRKEEVAAFVSSRGSQDIVYRPPGLARTKKVKFDRAGEVLSVLEKLSWPAFKTTTDLKQKKLKDPIAGIGDTSGVGNKGRIKEEIRDGVASLSNATSAGCARCSINGWSWRSWARDRAKRRLQRRVSTVGRKVSTKELAQKFRKLSKKRDTNISYKGTSAVAPGPQAARKNRVTMRKLAVASEGSDMLRFNMLKVITTHTSSDLRI
jgi:hypothetical protein